MPGKASIQVLSYLRYIVQHGHNRKVVLLADEDLQRKIVTSPFSPSDNQQLFVMRRFDLKDDGSCRAMEGMALLQGKSTNDKYRSSYESMSKVLKIGVKPEWHLLKLKMHIISVNSSLRGTKQSLVDRCQTLIDCRATARNDGGFGLSKCHSGQADFTM